MPAMERVVAIEEHFWIPELRDRYSGPRGISAHTPAQQLDDLGEIRLQDMDAAGIDMQVISHMQPGTQIFEAETAVAMARKANDALHAAICAHPSRFAGFAELPTVDPEAAADELERMVTRHGFKGALINGLTAGYGGSAVISDVDLTVGSKEIVTVIGPNGAGKSTMLGAVMGRVKVMAGSIVLRGEPITRMRAHELSRLGIGYVPQTRDIFETLTVRENLEMGGYSLASSRIPAAMEKVLSIFPDLTTHLSKRAGTLSGGERKMLAVGRVLMPDPSLLVLDEPTANLSPKLARMVLREQVPRLAESGVAVLLVEQKALEALEISDWGYLLVAGKVQLSGKARDLATRPGLREMFLGQVVASLVGETEPASERP